MNRGRKRWLFRLALVLVAGLAFYEWAIQGQSQELIVENRSGQQISQLKITLAGQTSTFRDMKSGTKVSAPFRYRSDDLFEVEGQLEDGTTIHSKGLIGDRVHVLILPGGGLEFRPKGKT